MDIGEKIKQLRLENSLTQEELAQRCELSKGFISQVERDLTSPSIASLKDILESLGTNLTEFFSETEDEKIVFAKDDFSETKDDHLKYSLEWLVPNAQKNMMEPIMLTIEPGGQFMEDTPHQGQEFGYVISGAVLVCLGGKRHKARKGEAFYYKTNTDHTIKNAGRVEAKVLMVCTPPNF